MHDAQYFLNPLIRFLKSPGYYDLKHIYVHQKHESNKIFTHKPGDLEGSDGDFEGLILLFLIKVKSIPPREKATASPIFKKSGFISLVPLPIFKFKFKFSSQSNP